MNNNQLKLDRQEGNVSHDGLSARNDGEDPVTTPSVAIPFSKIVIASRSICHVLFQWICQCFKPFPFAIGWVSQLCRSLSLVHVACFGVIMATWRRLPEEKRTFENPSAVQHFTFEPVGFSYATAKPLNFSVHKLNQGYYKEDVKALTAALLTVPVQLPHRTKNDNVVEKNNAVCAVPLRNFYPFELKIKRNAGGPTRKAPFSVEQIQPDAIVAAEQQFLSVKPKPPGTVIVLDLHLGQNPSLQGQTALVRNFATFVIGTFRDYYSSYNKAFNDSASENIQVPPMKLFEVVVVLNSNGGSVSEYGLLAEQLRRIRNEPGMTLTVCCDEVALSGGYMVASVATPGQLLAAPFASIGSIGVITSEILNFQKVLDEFGVQHVQLRGGDAKDSIGWLGEIRQEQIDRGQAHVDGVHHAFRKHVEDMRGESIPDIDVVSSGNYWLGTQALELGLIDHLATSDEYIDKRVRDGDKVIKLGKPKGDTWSDLRSLLTMPDSQHHTFSDSDGIVSFATMLEKFGLFLLAKIMEQT